MIENKISIIDTPGKQLFIFVGIVLVSVLFVSLAGIVFAYPFFDGDVMSELSKLASEDANMGLLKYFQIVNQLGLFIVPTLVFGHFVMKGNSTFYKITYVPPAKYFLLAIALLFAALPIVGILTEWNEAIQLPDYFNSINQWMRDSEDSARRITTALLEQSNIWDFFVNMIMIAIIPAIGEELFFRGVIQQLFQRWFNNSHSAIIVTAIIFSAFHMQFFGFFPRLLLGAILGYLFYWTNSLWVPILTHFINNGMAVVVGFLEARNGIPSYIDDMSNNEISIYTLIISLLFVSAIVFLFSKKKALNSNN